MKKLLFCALFLSLGGCKFLPYVDEHKTKDEVIALFQESTKKNLDLTIPDRGRLTYFIGPAAQLTEQDRISWKQLVDLIESETPMRFVKAKDEQSANFIVVVAPAAEAEGYSCSESTTTHRSIQPPLSPPVLKEVKVDIQRKNTNLLRPCLVRQIMVAVGFQPVDRGDTFSVLNRRTALGQPTSTDLYLINLMLKTRLTPDMSSAEIEAALSQQYDRIQLSSINGKNFAELDAAQRQKLIDALQPRKPATKKEAQ